MVEQVFTANAVVDNKNQSLDDDWSLIIKPKSSWLDLHISDLWRYRDLLIMFVRRDFVAVYKQTILGPIWFFLQPILTTLVFTLVFGKIAGISTDGLPKILFYLSGIVGWNYFAECLNATSQTFTQNANIFGKVYFPRLIAPISTVISNLLKFAIQFVLFIVILIYFIITGANVHPGTTILLTPLLVLIMAGLGLGSGMIVSALTTKYRDLKFLITFGVQLLMYATPVIYPMSKLPEKYRLLVLLNPMSSIIETFRYAFLGSGTFNLLQLLYSAAFTVILLFIGIITFNKVEKTFMDIV